PVRAAPHRRPARAPSPRARSFLRPARLAGCRSSGLRLKVAYTSIVDTIAAMSAVTPVSSPVAKPQGCTNLKLRQLVRAVGAHYDAEVGKAGLKLTQCSLLSRIAKLGPTRAGELAQQMRMSASTLSRNLRP